MKSMKKISLLMAFLMIFGILAPSVASAAELSNTEKIDWLVEEEIVNGRALDNAETDLALAENITRAEITKLLVFAMERESLAEAVKDTEGKFSDVGTDHWANGFINVASSGSQKIIVGYPEGNFLPSNDVTYAEVATMLSRIVDPTIDNGVVVWPTTYTAAAEEKGLLEGVTVSNWNGAAVREDVFVMIYNTLAALEEIKEEAEDNAPGSTKNQHIGIVSNIVSNRLELNDNPELRFEMTFDTFYANNIQPKTGALVRIALDADKNITHVVVLGDGEVGAINANKNWVGIAEETVSTDFSDLTDVATVGKNSIVVDGIEGAIGVNTRIFVNDKATREVSTIAEAIGDRTAVPKVYMGYNPIGNLTLKEATVIVFNYDTEGLAGVKSTVRVVEGIDAFLKATVEDVKGTKTELDFSKVGTSPFTREGLEKDDIVEVTIDRDNNRLVDYNSILVSKEAPVVTVTKIDGNAITVKDTVGEVTYYQLDRANVFGTLAVGSKIQLIPSTRYQQAFLLEYVSVVGKDVAGRLDIPNRDFKEVTGQLVMASQPNANTNAVTMYVQLVEGGKFTNVVSYSVLQKADIDRLANGALNGRMITFSTVNVDGINDTLAFGIKESTQVSPRVQQFVDGVKKAIADNSELLTNSAGNFSVEDIDTVAEATALQSALFGPRNLLAAGVLNPSDLTGILEYARYTEIMNKVNSILNPEEDEEEEEPVVETFPLTINVVNEDETPATGYSIEVVDSEGNEVEDYAKLEAGTYTVTVTPADATQTTEIKEVVVTDAAVVLNVTLFDVDGNIAYDPSNPSQTVNVGTLADGDNLVIKITGLDAGTTYQLTLTTPDAEVTPVTMNGIANAEGIINAIIEIPTDFNTDIQNFVVTVTPAA